MSRLLGGLALCFVCLLGACGGGGDTPATPTNTPVAQVTATSVPPGEGSVASDGQCQIMIPDTWVDYGTGRGETSLGDRWVVFGGAVAGDAGWTSAVDLAKAQKGGADATIVLTDTSITITQAANRGYLTRVRFDNRYCEFSVAATADRSEEVLQTWTSVAATLQPKV